MAVKVVKQATLRSNMDSLDFFLWCFGIWALYKIARAYMVVSVISSMPVQLIFPVKLEYNDNQWFAWDNDDEFLGQAPTKQELLDQISTKMDFPRDKFTIISEQPLLTPTKG